MMKKIFYLFVFLIFISFASQAEETKKVVNIYNWSDYVSPKSLKEFEKKTGIKPVYDVYDSNQMLEAKLVVGKTGYDIVVPTSTPYLARQIKQGLFQKIDKSKLKNYENLDPFIMEMLGKADPAMNILCHGCGELLVSVII